MSKIADTFETYGHTHTQLLIYKNIALYKLCIAEKDCMLKGWDGVIGYDVVIIVDVPENVINGKMIPSRKNYPSAEQFGKFGWNFNTYEAARNKFNELTDNPERLIVNDDKEYY